MVQPMSPRDQQIWIRAEYWALHTPFTFDQWRDFLFMRHERLSDRELFPIMGGALSYSGLSWIWFTDYVENYIRLRETSAHTS